MPKTPEPTIRALEIAEWMATQAGDVGVETAAVLHALVAERNTLRERVAALEADARRLDWLQDNDAIGLLDRLKLGGYHGAFDSFPFLIFTFLGVIAFAVGEELHDYTTNTETLEIIRRLEEITSDTQRRVRLAESPEGI